MTLNIQQLILIIAGVSHGCESFKPVYVQNNSTLRLSCDYKATTHSIVWLGTPGLTTYADGLVKNEIKDKNGRLEISGNHSLGEFDLVVKTFTTDDEGLFQCHTVSNGKAVKAEFFVSVMRPPSDMIIQAKEDDNRIFCFENRSLSLNCTVESGIPSETIYWEREGHLVASGGPGFLSYTFIASISYHLNIFTCKAQNAAVKHPIEKMVQTYVYAFPTVQITADPSTLLETGEKLKIVCEYNSNHPDVQISIQHVQTSGKITRFDSNTLYKENVQRQNAGIYSCTVENPVGIAADEVNIVIKYMPMLVNTSQHKYYGEIGKQVDITLKVASYEIPSVSWMASGTYGKCGRWNILENKFSDEFLLSSSILPTKQDHFRKYSIRIRNSKGISDTHIQLKEYENTVNVEPSIIECNTSSAITIVCYLEQVDYFSWTSSWTHYRQNVFIRSIDSTTKYNMTRIDIQFCDYQDTGTYVCTWRRQTTELKANAHVQVKSQPIFTDQRINVNDTSIELKMFFYSQEYPEEISWYYVQFNQSRGEQLQQICENTSVILTCYDKKVAVDGYAALLFGKVDSPVSRDISCFIRNSFGTSEAIFSVQSIRRNKVEHTKLLTNSTSFIGSTTENDPYILKTSSNTLDTKDMYVYFLVAVIVIMFGLATICAVVMCFITKILKRVYTVNRPPNIPTVEYITPDPISVYEEINLSEYLTPVTSGDEQSDNESVSFEELDILNDTSVSTHSYEDLESLKNASHDYIIVEIVSNDLNDHELHLNADDVLDEQQQINEERYLVETQLLDCDVECKTIDWTETFDEDE